MSIFRPHHSDASSPEHRVSRGVRTAAVASLVVAGLVAVPVVAAAASPSGGSTTVGPSSTGGPSTTRARSGATKERCEGGVTRREDKLNKDLDRVREATGAPAHDRALLTGQLHAVAGDLDKAESSIEAAGAPSELRAACEKMVTSTRVYVLYGPKTDAVVATSRLAEIDARVSPNQDRIDRIIARAEKRGVPADRIADAEAKATDARSRLADAHTRIDGLTARLSPVTPAQVNDGSAKTTMAAARDDLRRAADDARAIRADLVAIRVDLRTR